jgi:hypothetical protein
MQYDKKFYFMAGLPRSGGTLLSSILNQNPEIYVSPQSTLPNTLGAAYNQYQSQENKDYDQFQQIYNVMEMIIPTFYSSRTEKYIVDRNFSWLDAHPYIILEHHLKNEIRVVCPVRDILGILASWNRLCEKDKNNSYDKEILKNYKDKRPMADRRADHFFNLGDNKEGLMHSLENLKRVLYPEFKDNIMLVEYDDLTLKTEDTINNIYDFLGIDKFVHNYNQIPTSSQYTDHWGIKDHHKVKPTIQREEDDYSKIFSKDTIKKYSGLEFWK